MWNLLAIKKWPGRSIREIYWVSPWVESLDRLRPTHHVAGAAHWMALAVKRGSWGSHERRTAASDEVVGTTRAEIRSGTESWSWASRPAELRAVARGRSERAATCWSIVGRTRRVLWRRRESARRRAGTGGRWSWRCWWCGVLRCVWAGRWALKTVRLHVARGRALVRLREDGSGPEIVGIVRSASKVVARILRICWAVTLPIVSGFVHAQWRSGWHATAWNT